jgi:hypothetical protein
LWIEPRSVPFGQFKLLENDPVDGTISAVNTGVPRIMVVICVMDVVVTFGIAENTTKKSSCVPVIMALNCNDIY